MVTRRTTKKKAAKRSSKKGGGRKKAAKKGSKQATEFSHECGEFEVSVEGNTLSITIIGDANFDASVEIKGHACRTILGCRIVNGQWEC